MRQTLRLGSYAAPSGLPSAAVAASPPQTIISHPVQTVVGSFRPERGDEGSVDTASTAPSWTPDGSSDSRAISPTAIPIPSVSPVVRVT
ncbi:MAG TPA: hypothetical protein VNJ28_03980, partial [Candidatus Limnocylindrales bacterium]|nr:hypothetical protein [Candidatus Limnocylindrales bacterium]